VYVPAYTLMSAAAARISSMEDFASAECDALRARLLLRRLTGNRR
jgi:hypothetical protein